MNKVKEILAIVVVLGLAHSAAAQSSVEETVAKLGRVGFVSSPSFSPAGDSIAFLSNMSGSPQVWTVATTGGWPRQITAYDDPVSSAAWSPDGKWIAYSVAPGGGLNEQIYIVKPDGTGIRRITAGGEENNRLGLWSRDGRFLTYGSSLRSPAAIDGYVYDLESEKNRMAVQNSGIASFADVSSDGKSVIINRVVSRGDNDLFLVDLKTGTEAKLTPHSGPGSFSARFAAKPGSMLLITNKDRDLRALQMLTSQGGKLTSKDLASRPDAELDDVVVSDDGSISGLFWNAAGRSEVEMMNMKSGSRRTVVLPGEIAGGGVFSSDGKQLAMVVSGASKPSGIWIVDVASLKSRQVAFSQHPGVDLSTIVRPELRRYKAHDGLELSGWLYRPAGSSDKPLPIVLSFHGGPEGQERTSLNPTYQGLLARGIAVFAPNVRGSSGFGKKFVNLDNGALRVDSVRDIKATADYLVSNGTAAAGKLGIMGGSYGGYMVMAGLTEYPDLFAAGANLFGIVNFETFFKHTQPWMAAVSTIEYGDPATEAAMLRSLSPIHKLDRVKAPTLVLHGANDTNVPVVEAEQVVDTLRKRGVPVEYVLFPDEGHGWRKTPNRIKSGVTISNFFAKYLTPK